MQANKHPPPWHSLSTSETLTRLDTPRTGLTLDIVDARRTQVGAYRLLNQAPDFAALDHAAWGRIFVFGLIVYSVVEIEKAVIRRNHKPAIH